MARIGPLKGQTEIDLVAIDLREAFLTAVSLTLDCDWQETFAMAGFDIPFAPSLITPADYPTYLQSARWRVSQYFEVITWSDRTEVSKVMRIVNPSLKKLATALPWVMRDDIEPVLASHDLFFDGDRVRRRSGHHALT